MVELLGKLLLTDIVCFFTCTFVLAALNDVGRESKCVRFAYESAGWLAVFYLFMFPILLLALIWFT